MTEMLVIKINAALDATRRMFDEMPDWEPISVSLEQLLLLQDFGCGKRTDFELLRKVNLGLLAVREFETGWPEYAKLLIEIQGLVERELL